MQLFRFICQHLIGFFLYGNHFSQAISHRICIYQLVHLFGFIYKKFSSTIDRSVIEKTYKSLSTLQLLMFMKKLLMLFCTVLYVRSYKLHLCHGTVSKNRWPMFYTNCIYVFIILGIVSKNRWQIFSGTLATDFPIPIIISSS